MNEFVIIDLETTGLDAEKDQIIDVAAVKVKRGLIVDQYTTLIDCDKPINDFISDLTGITDDMLVNQPHIEDIIDSLTDFIGDAVICAHNAQFDSAFLHKHWNDQREWLDTITLAQIVYPCAASYSLSWLTSMLDIVNSGAHRALADALATAELLIRLKNGLKLLPEKARRDLLTLAADNNAPIDELLRRECALPSGVAEPAVVQPRWNVSNSVEKKETDEFYRIKPEDIERYLAADGEYASRLAGFEERPQQLSMAKEVAEAFNHQSFLLAEAGTGTGKSLAYLLPAALFAAGSGKKVAISTHTKNLQEQLLNKDIPMLGKLINRPLTAAVLKGRSNYLCRRLYQYLLKQPPENLRYFLMRVAVWQAGSISGDGDELSLTGYEQWRWQRVCASKENCTVFCPYFKNGGCYVQKSRTVANNCDIYILNHSLLVANAAMENSFLPPFSHLVIDEAHHLEKAAEEQLASEVDFYALLNLLGRLKRREKGKETGVLMSLRHYTGGMFAGGLCQEVLNRQLDDLERAITNNLSAGEDFFGLLQQFFKGDAAKESYYPAMIRVVERHYHDEDWQTILSKGEELIEELNQMAKLIFRIQDTLQSDQQDEEEEHHIPGKDELQSIGAYAREMAATLQICLKPDQENYVAWVRFADGEKKPSFNIAPIELGQLLHSCLFAHCEAVVLTSATMTAANSFAFFKQRLGLNLLPDAPRELLVPSPFLYKEQALFTIVDDLPDWSKSSEIVAVNAIGTALIQLLTASSGRAIVLFTSHQQLRAVFNEIRRPLLEQGITVLAHGISGGPVQLLQRLKTEKKCAILGANSFWEGVDVIGSALSLIVVVRLPFWPPNTPTTAAKMERIEATGHSSFGEYSLPQAILRFKQGFGRLIRSSEDSGVFCVLDKRLMEKGYGRSFMRALPEMRRIHGGSAQIATAIKDWLDTPEVF